MQRIDENTYIDDTLVTCAEYQLFIDEMREQGKYYQPDHWTSHQFPVGQAREPILGVRYSDAIAFCEWLTKRKGGEWLYHLPSQKTELYWNIGGTYKSPVGFWLFETMWFESRFSWIGSVPNNLHALDLETINSHFTSVVRNFKPDQLRLFDEALENALNNSEYVSMDFTISTLETFINNELPHRYLDRNKLAIRNTGIVLAQIIEQISRDSTENFSILFKELLYSYIDLFTLQERIAGRSPAFEGIRLVKERIR